MKQRAKYQKSIFNDFDEYEKLNHSSSESRLIAKSLDKVEKFLKLHFIQTYINFSSIFKKFGLKLKLHLKKVTNDIRCRVLSEITPRQIAKMNKSGINTVLTYFAFIKPLETLDSFKIYICQITLPKGTRKELYDELKIKIQNLRNSSLNKSINFLNSNDDDNNSSNNDIKEFPIQQSNDEIEEILESFEVMTTQSNEDNKYLNQEKSIEYPTNGHLLETSDIMISNQPNKDDYNFSYDNSNYLEYTEHVSDDNSNNEIMQLPNDTNESTFYPYISDDEMDIFNWY